MNPSKLTTLVLSLISIVVIISSIGLVYMSNTLKDTLKPVTLVADREQMKDSNINDLIDIVILQNNKITNSYELYSNVADRFKVMTFLLSLNLIITTGMLIFVVWRTNRGEVGD